jgi:hypothetical protein
MLLHRFPAPSAARQRSEQLARRRAGIGRHAYILLLATRFAEDDWIMAS